MKKLFRKLILSGALILSPTFILSSCGGNGGETTPEIKTFTIKLNFDSEKGNVVLSKSSGNVGESIQVTITPTQGFSVKEIKFNEETLQFAPTLTLTPKEGENQLNVTFAEEAIIEKALVVSGTFKTEYIVGETFSLDGIEVKLVTTTNGVSDQAVAYKDYKTSLKDGYTFKESDITMEGDTLDVTIYSDDETITSASIELVVKQKPVVEVGMTPADFLKKMKTVGKYKVENAETTGIYIPNANYWEAKVSDYTTNGFAQNGEKIIIYTIVGDRVNEIKSYKYTDKFSIDDGSGQLVEHTYTGMYDDEFTNYLTNIEEVYFNRGIGFISDEKIENYRKTLKPTVSNPNEFVFGIKEDAASSYARDIVQLTYNGTLALNDLGLAVTIGPRAKIKLTILNENSMKIDILNGSSVRYWPTETIITIDETLDIPEIQPFIKNEVVEDLDLARAKVAFNALRQGNFTTESGDVYNTDYLYRKKTNSAIFDAQKEFDFDGQHFHIGNYNVQFNDKNVATKDSLSQLEVGGHTPISSYDMLNKDAEYLPFYSEADNKLSLTYYANKDSGEYFNGIPSLYTNLFNVPSDSEEDIHFDNLEFKVQFEDKECTKVSYIDVKFGRMSGNKTTKLTDFGTSKVAHVDTFISSIK